MKVNFNTVSFSGGKVSPKIVRKQLMEFLKDCDSYISDAQKPKQKGSHLSAKFFNSSAENTEFENFLVGIFNARDYFTTPGRIKHVPQKVIDFFDNMQYDLEMEASSGQSALIKYEKCFKQTYKAEIEKLLPKS